MRTSTGITTIALLGTLILAGCTTPPGDDAEPDPLTPDEPTAACEVGHWELDVADYEAQALPFLLDHQIPITEYALTGEGSLDIGDDGFLDGVVSLTSTGILVPPGADPVAISVPSSYTFSGQWAPGAEEGTVDLTDWAQVADVGAESGAAPPMFDFTDIPTVRSDCDADTLRLQGPDAPFSALWHRG
ncbi:MAG: hypothetical protein ABI566_05395 [Pseudolysinimonas sp.]